MSLRCPHTRPQHACRPAPSSAARRRLPSVAISSISDRSRVKKTVKLCPFEVECNTASTRHHCYDLTCHAPPPRAAEATLTFDRTPTQLAEALPQQQQRLPALHGNARTVRTRPPIVPRRHHRRLPSMHAPLAATTACLATSSSTAPAPSHARLQPRAAAIRPRQALITVPACTTN